MERTEHEEQIVHPGLNLHEYVTAGHMARDDATMDRRAGHGWRPYRDHIVCTFDDEGTGEIRRSRTYQRPLPPV